MADKTAETPVEQNPETMPMEDLEELIKGAALGGQAELPLEPEQAEEPETAEVGEPEPEPEPEEAAAEDTEAEPEAEETEEEVDAGVEVPGQLDYDILQAKLDEAIANAKHQEVTASRHGGEVGFLNQRLAALEAQNKQLLARLQGQTVTEETTYEPTAPAPTVQAPPQAPPTLSDPNTTFLVSQAIQLAGNAFVQAHPEVIIDGEGEQAGEKVLDPLFMKEFARYEKEHSELALAPDPVVAGQRATHLLESTFSGFYRRKATERVKALQRKKADSAAALKKKKRAGAISTSGGKAAAKTKKTLDPMSMPMDDLKALIQQANR
jgi:hypothetical protein